MEELVALLAAGDVDGFNEKRPRRGKLDLFAVDLAGIKAPGADLSAAEMEKADLSGADLTDAVMARANLSGADISDAKLGGVMGLQSRWRETFIDSTDLRDADLSAADLSDAEISSSDLSRVVFAGAKLKRTVFRDCKLIEADFNDARMAEIKIESCDFSKAILVEARLNQAVITGGSFAGADLSKARLGGADLSGADLSGAKLVEADLSGAKLAGARLVGTDLTRADLTGVEMEGVDLSQAIVTDAQLPGSHLEQAAGEVPPLKVKIIEEPLLAASGKRVAALWENPEPPPGKSWLRVLVGTLGEESPEDAPALPVPAELVVARTLAGTPSGFQVLVLVERPGGTAAMVFPVGLDNTIGEPKRVQLGYTPAARPILRHEGKEIILYGIAREGPGVVIHRLGEEGLEPIHGEAMRTVRGFVSDHHPVVLTKGGTLVIAHQSGLGPPMTAPGDFPGRRCASAPLAQGLGLAWLPSSAGGIKIAGVGTGDDEERHLLKKKMIGLLDAASFDEAGAWAVFTLESGEAGGNASAWALRLPDGEPFPIIEDEDRDITELRLVPGSKDALVAVGDLEGTLEILALKDGEAVSLWRAD